MEGRSAMAQTADKKKAATPTAGQPAGKKPAKQTKKKAASEDRYTDPALREKLKAEVIAGDKGGKPGQWSARKAQLLTHAYESHGGGYTEPPDAAQQSLKHWGDEHWTTSDGKPAERPGGTTRYLPEKAWEELSPDEKAATNRRKRSGSREGKQFVANTSKAAEARKHAVHDDPENGSTVVDGKADSKKPASKKTATRTDGKKAALKKTASKTASKKPDSKKPASKTASKTTTKKAAPKKTAAKKTAPRKAPAKKKG